MTRAARAVALVVALVVMFACSRDARRDDVPRADPSPAAPPVTPAAGPPVTPAAGPPVTPAAGPPVLPPVELTCASDTDCALTYVHLDGAELCCRGCGLATAGRADWVEKVRTTCAARPDVMAQCLPLGCPQGAQRAACRDRRCVVVP